MKKPITRRYVLLLLVSAGLCMSQSACNTEQEFIDFSYESSHHLYQLEGKDRPSKDADDVAGNVAFFLLLGLYESSSSGGNKSSYTGPYSGALYASADNQLALSEASALRGSQPPPAPKMPEFAKNIRILTGLAFVQKNSRDGDSKIRLSYLQVPVLGLYMHQLPNKGKVFGGLGPFFAYGIRGVEKTDDEKRKAFGSDGFRRFDAGLSVTAGYQIPRGFMFRAGYDWGLFNLSNDDRLRTRSRTFSISAACPVDEIKRVLGRK